MDIKRIESMKVKMYILTFNSEYQINDNLNSLFQSKLDDNLEINIISNHSNLAISSENKERLNSFGNHNILYNTMQCDWSWGYTTRNWNQSLILGFKTLVNPDCDLVICAQDDTNYDTNWLQTLKQRHSEGLEFIACGLGDCFCSYTPNAVKAIGLWDERFCTLNFSEFDYFLRAASWLGDKAAIDDAGGSHGEMCRFNGEKTQGIACKSTEDPEKNVLREIRQTLGNTLGDELFTYKWGAPPGHKSTWAKNNVGNCRVPLTPVFINYPYFEKDIPDIRQKGYMFL